MLEASSTSNDRTLAGITHLCVLVPVWGQIATLVIWLTQKDKAPFVRFHALQSGAYQLTVLATGLLGTICYFCASMAAVSALPWILGDLPSNNADPQTTLAMLATVFLPMLVPVLLSIGWLGAVLYAIVGAVKTFQGQPFEYAIIGTWIRKKVEQNPAIV